jgi:rRNA maturation endonuclease Nob1
MGTSQSKRHGTKDKRASHTVKVCFNCERMSESNTDGVCTVCGEELVKMSRSEFVARMKGDM